MSRSWTSLAAAAGFLLAGAFVDQAQAQAFEFTLPTRDGRTQLTGQVDLPEGVASCTDVSLRLPAVLMVPGTGEFDRDVGFGKSGTDRDFIFKELARELTRRGVVVVRSDYRGVRCSWRGMPQGTSREAFLKACVDREVRAAVTPETMRNDLQQVFDYAALTVPCIDRHRITVFGHSEASFHIGSLVRDHRIEPAALVFMGMVAESPKSLVRWQMIDRLLLKIGKVVGDRKEIRPSDLEKAGLGKVEAPERGFWTIEELRRIYEENYETTRNANLALPDGDAHEEFWSNRWWKMWWSDENAVADQLQDFQGEIVAHGGDQDFKVYQPRQFEFLSAKKDQHWKDRLKLVTHPGKGHTLGEPELVGPMDPDSVRLLLEDLTRLSGVPMNPREMGPLISAEELNRRNFLGVTFRGVPKGLEILSVLPATPAWEAGIRSGDLLTRLNGESLAEIPEKERPAAFAARWQKLETGMTANISLIRRSTEFSSERDGVTSSKDVPPPGAWDTEFPLTETPGFSKAYALRWKRLETEKTVLATAKPASSPEKAMHTIFQALPPEPLENFAVRKLTAEGYLKDHQDLLQRLRDIGIRPDPYRIPEVDWIRKHPFELRARSHAVLDRSRKGPADFLREAARLEGSAELPRPEPAVAHSGGTLEAQLAWMGGLLKEAKALRTEAFSALSSAELEELRGLTDATLKRFEEWNYLFEEKRPSVTEKNGRLIELGAKVKLEPLIRATIKLLPLASPETVFRLRRALKEARKDLGRETVLERSTEAGLIRIAGTGDNRHTDLESAKVALLYDLGGNDFYADRVAASGADLPISIAVDAAGDDIYDSRLDYAQGAGVLGIAILADLAGNDRYGAIRGTQGFGLYGVGLLIDSGGADLYRAHTYAQGVSWTGVGSLWDLRGDDRYEAHLLAQGVGIAGGISGLFDLAGSDEYIAKGFQGSGYGTPGTFQGWSQGVGLGVRSFASGGLGILWDGAGRDRMEAGDFSQGGGYSFGWGILGSGGREPDAYYGNRYAQGFAAHYALGAFFEEGGDDRYESFGGVSTGNANDLSISWFEDRGGRDAYPARLFSLGASANNSLSVFLDPDPAPNRFIGAEEVANGQVNEYHGGTSLSLFLERTPGPLQVVFKKGSRLFIRGDLSREGLVSASAR